MTMCSTNTTTAGRKTTRPKDGETHVIVLAEVEQPGCRSRTALAQHAAEDCSYAQDTWETKKKKNARRASSINQ